jgi:hypothetical protein
MMTAAPGHGDVTIDLLGLEGFVGIFRKLLDRGKCSDVGKLIHFMTHEPQVLP